MFDIYTKVIMRYENTRLESLAYDSLATNQKEFSPLLIRKPKQVTYGETGRLLNRGMGYSKTFYKYYKYEFTLSADQLADNDIIDFIDNFLNAPIKYLIFYKGGELSGYNYVEVMSDFGDSPIDMLDDIQFMPEGKFTFTTI